MNKKGLSKRDQLVLESIDLITNDHFLGRGFHFTHMNKEKLKREDYVALGINNTQNTILSIFIELGIFGGIYFKFLDNFYNISMCIKKLCFRYTKLSKWY